MLNSTGMEHTMVPDRMRWFTNGDKRGTTHFAMPSMGRTDAGFRMNQSVHTELPRTGC